MTNYTSIRKFLTTASTFSLLISASNIANAAIEHETTTGGTSTFQGDNITNGEMEDSDIIVFKDSSYLIANKPLNSIIVNAVNAGDNLLVASANVGFSAINKHINDNRTNLRINNGITVTLNGDNTDAFNSLRDIDGSVEGDGILVLNSSDPIYGDIGNNKRLEKIIIKGNLTKFYNDYQSDTINLHSKNVNTDELDLTANMANLLLAPNSSLVVKNIFVGDKTHRSYSTLTAGENSFIAGNITFQNAYTDLFLEAPFIEGNITFTNNNILHLDVSDRTTNVNSMTINGSIDGGFNNSILIGENDSNQSTYIIEEDIGKTRAINKVILMTANTKLVLKGSGSNLNELTYAMGGGTLSIIPSEDDSIFTINSTGTRGGNIAIGSNKSSSIVGNDSLGNYNAPLYNLNLNSTDTGETSFNLPVYSKKVNIEANGGKYHFYKGLHSVEEINFNNDATLDISIKPSLYRVYGTIYQFNDINFDAKVNSRTPEKGSLIFTSERNTFIKKEIGSRDNHLKNITLQGRKYSLENNIFAKTIIARNTDLHILKPITMGIKGGTIDFSSSLINIGANIVTIPANITFSPTTKLNYEFDGRNNGLIDNTEASIANLPDGLSISLKKTSSQNFSEGQELIIYKATSPTIGNVTIIDPNGSATFSSRVDNGVLIVHVDKVTPITNILHQEWAVRHRINDNTFIENEINYTFSPSTQATANNDFYQQINLIRPEKAEAARVQMLEKLGKTATATSTSVSTSISTAATQTVQATLSNSTSVVETRMLNITTPEIDSDNPDIQIPTGVASGSIAEQDELWITGFTSSVKQGLRNGDAGYRANTIGGAVGYDLNVNDDLLVGVSFTYSNADIDQSDHKTGDKAEASTHMLGLYSSFDLTQNLFIQGLLNIGNTKVISDSNRVSYGRRFVAHGEYNISNYGLAVVAGYQFKYNRFLFTPTIGLQHNEFREEEYTEKGAEGQNLKVFAKKYNKFTGRAGLRVSTPTQLGQYKVTPNLNISLNHDFNNEGVRVKQMFVGTTNIMTTQSAKPAATSYTAGGGVSVKVNNIDIDLNYNLETKAKYIGHQGSFKLRINL
ncbi:MAG: cell surface antigen [Rickettsiaceae bacterium]|jgi:outer membrane autotransporter protein|nr:cell surface antigen [Rickettsiaceae bacterium]